MLNNLDVLEKCPCNWNLLFRIQIDIFIGIVSNRYLNFKSITISRFPKQENARSNKNLIAGFSNIFRFQLIAYIRAPSHVKYACTRNALPKQCIYKYTLVTFFLLSLRKRRDELIHYNSLDILYRFPNLYIKTLRFLKTYSTRN